MKLCYYDKWHGFYKRCWWVAFDFELVIHINKSEVKWQSAVEWVRLIAWEDRRVTRGEREEEVVSVGRHRQSQPTRDVRCNALPTSAVTQRTAALHWPPDTQYYFWPCNIHCTLDATILWRMNERFYFFILEALESSRRILCVMPSCVGKNQS